jgi:hypothetical protein
MSQACYIASLALLDLCGVDFPKKPEYTYEDIQFPDGYTKPSKEVFEAKLQEIVRERNWKNLREERNTRLAEVDWVFSGDYKLSPEEHALWVTYRKTLRELPSTTEDPANPTWPEKPSVTSGETKIVNATAEFMRMMNENTKLSSKITALERRSTDQELKLIRLSKLLEK